jgi:hypothetical protein
VAVHSVVEGRVYATCDQQTDAGEVEAQQETVSFWVGARVLLERGWKRWKIVLKRRQAMAEERKTKRGQRETNIGFGA